VPVISGGKTENIIAKVAEDFESSDIVRLNAQLDKWEANIDANVFKMYGLTKSDAGTALDSIGASHSYKTRVIELFS
jgi:hypothetical protein